MIDITKTSETTEFVNSRTEWTLSASKAWRGRVYRRSEGMEPGENAEWKAVAKVVKARDKHSCQSCGLKVGLSVHHILPRSDGGSDLPQNLITLCNTCHDEVEELGFKNELQIRDLRRKRKYIKHGNDVTNETPVKWQQWVYGGYKKPS